MSQIRLINFDKQNKSIMFIAVKQDASENGKNKPHKQKY